MLRFFTFQNQSNQKQFRHQKLQITALYSPSKRSVKAILDFAKAYHFVELSNCETGDLILN